MDRTNFPRFAYGEHQKFFGGLANHWLIIFCLLLVGVTAAQE
ncbi:MAG TPA: hypothetical protein VGJ33_12640 [Candidatus Angelobacter sp.]|jgi:hypothetical protein